MPSPLPPVTRLPRRGAPTTAPSFINLCGDYRFLRAGYWALVDAELAGVASRPSPLQAVTAQNAAAALLVAAHAGIPCVRWRVARRPEDVQTPALLLPNAGQTDASYEVHASRMVRSQWRSATRNGTRPALAVELEGPLRSIKSVVGLTARGPTDLAWQVWSTFQLPLCRIWYLDEEDGPRFLCIDPLPLHTLTTQELRLFEEVSRRPMSPS